MYSSIGEVFSTHRTPISRLSKGNYRENYVSDYTIEIPSNSVINPDKKIKGVVYLPPHSKELPLQGLSPQKQPIENYKQLIPALPKDNVALSPKIWGPLYWFQYKTTAVNYPKNPTKAVRDMMKNRIMLIPYELPCTTCRAHAMAFIDTKKDSLDHIVSSRDDLFNFFVDFQNAVAIRLGRPAWSYEKARKAYGL